jgi:hypothetical protein
MTELTLNTPALLFLALLIWEIQIWVKALELHLEDIES